jgi:hypothetical protein
MNAQTLSRRAALAGLATMSAATAAVSLPTSPDPIFDLIEEARVAERAVETAESDDEMDEAGRRTYATRSALLLVTPTTMAGLLALVAFVISESEQIKLFYFDDAAEQMAFTSNVRRALQLLMGLPPEPRVIWSDNGAECRFA